MKRGKKILKAKFELHMKEPHTLLHEVFTFIYTTVWSYTYVQIQLKIITIYSSNYTWY